MYALTYRTSRERDAHGRDAETSRFLLAEKSEVVAEARRASSRASRSLRKTRSGGCNRYEYGSRRGTSALQSSHILACKYRIRALCLHGGTHVCEDMSMKRKFDWSEVQRYCDAGHSLAKTLQHFGMSRLGVRKAVRRGDLCVDSSFFYDRRAKHDWVAIRIFYESGKSMRECAKHYGFCIESWSKAVRRGDVLPRPNGMPIEQLLSSEHRCRGNVKSRLLRAGLLNNLCARCGLRDWRGNGLSMHLDHINGKKNDHRLENLRMLCPNCHSQTETYGGRNKRRNRLLQEPRPNP